MTRLQARVRASLAWLRARVLTRPPDCGSRRSPARVALLRVRALMWLETGTPAKSCDRQREALQSQLCSAAGQHSCTIPGCHSAIPQHRNPPKPAAPVRNLRIAVMFPTTQSTHLSRTLISGRALAAMPGLRLESPPNPTRCILIPSGSWAIRSARRWASICSALMKARGTGCASVWPAAARRAVRCAPAWRFLVDHGSACWAYAACSQYWPCWCMPV